MLYVLDKFRICEDMDFENQGAIVGLMKDVVTYLKKDEIPCDKYSIKDIETYVKSLIDLQRTDEIVLGSWAVSPEPKKTPMDEEVDFHYFPTYLGISTLVLVATKYPDIAEEIPGFYTSLKNAMNFAVKNNFKGVGFNSDFQRLEAGILLSMGDVPLYLKNNPDFCPKMLEELTAIRNEVVKAVESKQIVNEFGINLGNEYKAILIGLAPLKD
jgi:hypothetical protein